MASPTFGRPTTPPLPKSAMAARPAHANVYKTAGVKPIATGLPFDPAAGAGTLPVITKVDLSLPIRGCRIVVSGRAVIGTADFTTGFPEGFLNLLSRIKIEGTNTRVGGNTTLWDLDLATAWVMQHLFQHKAGIFTINGVHVPYPGTPFPAVGASGYFNKAQGTYDFRIAVDLPFHPFKAPAAVRPGFLVRQEEWADTVQITIGTGGQAGAGATGCLGVAAATSTIVFSSYGSGAGKPAVDVYSLPLQMGSLKDSVVPGVITRVQRPFSTVMQAAGGGVTLVQLQKNRTARIYLKTGTISAAAPAFATLDDTNLTAIGLQSGGSNRSVKPLVDIQAYKQEQSTQYEREAIQGYAHFDFIESGNPDSAFPAQNANVVGTGSTFEVVGNVAGEANGYLIAVQEQITFLHAGALYTF